jgi:hypothetical protein
MSRTAKALILALLLAALPFRGYAGVLTALCEAHHGGAAASPEHGHEHGDGRHHDADDGGGAATHTASLCSICASCCAGASLAPDAPPVVALRSPGSEPIAFVDRGASGFVPEQFDRPPLVS